MGLTAVDGATDIFARPIEEPDMDVDGEEYDDSDNIADDDDDDNAEVASEEPAPPKPAKAAKAKSAAIDDDDDDNNNAEDDAAAAAAAAATEAGSEKKKKTTKSTTRTRYFDFKDAETTLLLGSAICLENSDILSKKIMVERQNMNSGNPEKKTLTADTIWRGVGWVLAPNPHQSARALAKKHPELDLREAIPYVYQKDKDGKKRARTLTPPVVNSVYNRPNSDVLQAGGLVHMLDADDVITDYTIKTKRIPWCALSQAKNLVRTAKRRTDDKVVSVEVPIYPSDRIVSLLIESNLWNPEAIKAAKATKTKAAPKAKAASKAASKEDAPPAKKASKTAPKAAATKRPSAAVQAVSQAVNGGAEAPAPKRARITMPGLTPPEILAPTETTKPQLEKPKPKSAKAKAKAKEAAAAPASSGFGFYKRVVDAEAEIESKALWSHEETAEMCDEFDDGGDDAKAAKKKFNSAFVREMTTGKLPGTRGAAVVAAVIIDTVKPPGETAGAAGASDSDGLSEFDDMDDMLDEGEGAAGDEAFKVSLLNLAIGVAESFGKRAVAKKIAGIKSVEDFMKYGRDSIEASGSLNELLPPSVVMWLKNELA